MMVREMARDMHAALERTIKLAHELIDQEQEAPILPVRRPEALMEALDLTLDRPARDEDQVFELLREVVLATPKTSSWRFFNQLFAGRDTTAAAAEVLAGLMNVSTYTYKAAGPQALIEREVARKMCDLVGFTNGEGTSVPGGSMANLVGMVLARNAALPDGREQGLDGRTLTVYLSADGHYSTVKNAGMLGIGRANVRKVPVDRLGAMDVHALTELIAADRAAGHTPIMVVATAGTTVLGAFDPIKEIADITDREGLWLHVDGALGGTMLLHPQQRERLAGCERANSMSWNGHKLMGIPLICSFILVRDRGLLHASFNETAEYLFQADDPDLNMGTKSIQCGRRNDVLKLWAAWKLHGDKGWAARIDRQLKLAAHAVAIIQKSDQLTLTQAPTCTNVCFEVEGCSTEDICERLSQSGLSQIGWGIAHGRKVIRLVTANADTQPEHIEHFFEDLLAVAGELRA